MAHAEGPALHVEVVYAAAPHRLDLMTLRLPVGACVADALQASGLRERLGEAAYMALALGVWGRVVAPTTLLRDHDRIELYRPLVVDPKEARRLRYQRDGVRKARPR